MAVKTVATASDAVEAMRPDWELATALLGGTRAMRKAGQAYLPKWPNEEQKSYDARLSVAVLFPAYGRTVVTLAGKPFSKPVTLSDDVPEQFKPWLDDIDMHGRKLDVFAADCMEMMLGKGLGAILVEYPDASKVAEKTAAGVMTQAAEQAAGLRPYWLMIKPGQILGWRASRRNGAWHFDQFRFMEEVEEPDGDFATVCVKQVRVLEPGKWTTYRASKDKPDEWVQHEAGLTTLDFVPIVPLYGERQGFMQARPPLADLAYLNVAHWQSASDQQNVLHVARVPILAVFGAGQVQTDGGEVKDWEFTVGASSGAKLPPTTQGADMRYVEHSGAAIGAGQKDLESLEQRMRQAGAELLVVSATANTRIEAAGDNEMATCALQRMTIALQDALNLALDYTAKWVKADTGGTVTLFNRFGVLTMGEAEAQLIADAAGTGLISKETAFEEFKTRGIIAADRTWEEEKDRIAEDGPALGTMGDPANGGAGGSGAA